MKHFKKISHDLPAKAAEKGDVKSCGPVKEFFGACEEDDSIF